jgi:hypothetical protein
MPPTDLSSVTQSFILTGLPRSGTVALAECFSPRPRLVEDGALGPRLPRLAREVEDPRVVFVVRHPLDVLQTADTTGAVNLDEGRAAARIEPYLFAFGFGRVLPVFYERLTRVPEAELSRIADFCGVRITGLPSAEALAPPVPSLADAPDLFGERAALSVADLDADLRRFGRWLGRELSLTGYDLEVLRGSAPEWDTLSRGHRAGSACG